MQDQWEQIAIRSARAGDTQGWAMLYQGHVAAVFQYGLQLTQGHKELAEELVQETFVHAARGLHHYQVRTGTFRMWLFGIIKKRWQKHLTAEARRKGREERYAAQRQAYRKNDSSMDVHATLAQLPAKHRLILEHKYLLGYSLKEMGQRLQISIEAVESRLRRARQQFAEVYGRSIEKG